MRSARTPIASCCCGEPARRGARARRRWRGDLRFQGDLRLPRRAPPGPRLYPRDLALRARCRYLELNPTTRSTRACSCSASSSSRGRSSPSSCPERCRPPRRCLARHYAALEREIAGRDWFLGEFSLADIALTPHLRSAAFMGHPPGEKHPALAAWLARGAARPSLKRAMRELAEGYAASQQPDSLFDAKRLHWRATGSSLRCAWGSASGSRGARLRPRVSVADSVIGQQLGSDGGCARFARLVLPNHAHYAERCRRESPPEAGASRRSFSFRAHRRRRTRITGAHRSRRPPRSSVDPTRLGMTQAGFSATRSRRRSPGRSG